MFLMPAGSLSITSCTLTVKAKEDRKASTHQPSQIPFFRWAREWRSEENVTSHKKFLVHIVLRHIVATFILLYTRRSTIFLNPDLASSIMLSVLRFCDSTSNVFFFCILVDMSTSHVSRVTVHVARTLHASRVVSLLCIAHRFRALHERVAVLCFQTFSGTLLFTAHMSKTSWCYPH